MMFGEIVRGHRRRLGLTQEELAERTGISVRGIRNLEAGRIQAPRPGTLRVLAEAFALQGADRDKLFTFVLAEDAAAGTASRAGMPIEEPPHAGDGWHTERFSVLARLDAPGVETYQDWRIVADRDGLDRITTAVSTPLAAAGAADLTVEVRHGARLLSREHPLPHRSQFTLVLPRALRAGESHECGIIVRLAAGQWTRPHYVLTATRPCEVFALRVRFHPGRLPRWVRRVSGEPVRMLDSVAPGPDELEPDAVGEVYTEFHRPALYLAHGVQWQPAD